jgi:hypothetical protein
MQVQEALTVFRLGTSYNRKELAHSYRRLVRTVHPDHLTEATAQEQRAANDELARINYAFELLERALRAPRGRTLQGPPRPTGPFAPPPPRPKREGQANRSTGPRPTYPHFARMYEYQVWADALGQRAAGTPHPSKPTDRSRPRPWKQKAPALPRRTVAAMATLLGLVVLVPLGSLLTQQ